VVWDSSCRQYWRCLFDIYYNRLVDSFQLDKDWFGLEVGKSIKHVCFKKEISLEKWGDYTGVLALGNETGLYISPVRRGGIDQPKTLPYRPVEMTMNDSHILLGTEDGDLILLGHDGQLRFKTNVASVVRSVSVSIYGVLALAGAQTYTWKFNADGSCPSDDPIIRGAADASWVCFKQRKDGYYQGQPGSFRPVILDYHYLSSQSRLSIQPNESANSEGGTLVTLSELDSEIVKATMKIGTKEIRMMWCSDARLFWVSEEANELYYQTFYNTGHPVYGSFEIFAF
jgi:hypothetical protein